MTRDSSLLARTRIALSMALLLLSTFGSSVALAQTHAQVAAVQLWAEVQSSPARITLRWTPLASATGYTIYRRVKGATSWGTAIATPAGSAVQYADSDVSAGVYYEYRIARTSSLGGSYAGDLPGTSYIASGIEVELESYRGTVILLVDDTVAAPLASELTTLTSDLNADGWSVIRHDVSRTASVTSIRTLLQTDYNANPTVVRSAYLVGHVPVPYSGNISPAGHFPDHYGAWAADSYYAEMNGTWTDSTVNNAGGSRAETRNIPGDGKFDQSDIPTAVELQLGRVDLSRMPAFGSSEVELLRSYLNRAHQYKTAAWQPDFQGLVSDTLDWTGAGIAASGFRSIVALLTPAHTTISAGAPYGSYIGANTYVFGYAGAGGGYTAAAVSTDELASSIENGAVFTMSLGSYFGDWDNENNLLRAYIARGRGLVSVWSGLPNWWFHHMGMGDTVGYSTQVTQSNTVAQYAPIHNGWQSPTELGKVHLALMGDPSLRMRMIPPPTNLRTSDVGGRVNFDWTAATGAPLGYHVYKFDPTSGVVTRLTTSPVTGTTYASTTESYVEGRRFMVRAVKLEAGSSGSYYNLSLGAIATNTGPTTMIDAGVMPIDAGATPVDAGSSPVDSSVPPVDMGVPIDFGVAFDAGPRPDAGAATDSGSVTTPDSGLAMDFGLDRDLGAPVISGPPLTSSCACTVSTSAPVPLIPSLIFCLSLVLMQIRRATRRRATRSRDSVD
ncbi:MAG: hypothetical protein IPK60_16935 [Sandaracinaceae bacterium]|nr:hypothetical protein [Sandaracinaceae bacterium]